MLSNRGSTMNERLIFSPVRTLAGAVLALVALCSLSALAQSSSPTVSLSASPTTVNNGARSTLTWSSRNATSCSASGAWKGARPVRGSLSLKPPANASSKYTLTCTGAGGSARKSVSVTAKPPAPTTTFSAAPTTLTIGSASRLTWTSTNATGCTASGAWTGALAPSGSASVVPATTGSVKYSLACTGPGGTSSLRSVTITVRRPLPTLSLAAMPSTLVSGASTTLSWSSTDATACSASGGWSGSKGVNGSETLVPLATTSYSLNCSNSAGSASKSVMVTVTPVLPPTPPPLTTGYYGNWVDTGRAAGIVDNTVMLRDYINQQLSSADRSLFTQGMSFVRQQMDATGAALPADSFPLRTSASSGVWTNSKVSEWTSSFWPGMAWEQFRLTGDSKYAGWALQKADLIYGRRTETWTHDQGFLFGLSHIKALEFVTDAAQRTKYREGALTAAQTYIKKANPINGFISWHGSYAENKAKSVDSSVIDSMMNIPLMWWATEQTGDNKFRDVGLRQAEDMRLYALRPDYSSAHGVEFDPRNGVVIGQKTYQGYEDDSTWTRGHAWAVYGFSVVYAKTGDRKWLVTARGVADFYLQHPRLAADLVPNWDFDVPTIPNTYFDSSAAAAMAAGLQHLARFEDDPVRARYYMLKSIVILRSLSATPWLALGSNNKAVLLHGCQNEPKDVVDNGLIFGDYYYLESLIRLLHW